MLLLHQGWRRMHMGVRRGWRYLLLLLLLLAQLMLMMLLRLVLLDWGADIPLAIFWREQRLPGCPTCMKIGGRERRSGRHRVRWGRGEVDRFWCFVWFISFVIVHVLSECFVCMQYAAVSMSCSRISTCACCRGLT